MNENKNLKIKVSYKLFHNSSSAPFATVSARVTGNRVALRAVKLDEETLLAGTKGGVVHDLTLRNLLGNVRLVGITNSCHRSLPGGVTMTLKQEPCYASRRFRRLEEVQQKNSVATPAFAGQSNETQPAGAENKSRGMHET